MPDKIEEIYNKLRKFEDKMDLDRIKLAVERGDVTEVKKITEKHHQRIKGEKEISEIKKILKDLEEK